MDHEEEIGGAGSHRKSGRVVLGILAVPLLLSLPACWLEAGAEVGPPAPHAYGYPAQQEWVYYPDHEVYYRPSDTRWAYRHENRWVIEARLPPRVVIPSAAVSVRLDFRGDRPYERYGDHARTYPRGYRPRGGPGR